MTDQTIHSGFAYSNGPAMQEALLSVPLITAPKRFFQSRAGQSRAGGMVRALMEDFRAVPAEAWIILAVATVLSNLFIALA